MEQTYKEAHKGVELRVRERFFLSHRQNHMAALQSGSTVPHDMLIN